MSFGANEVNSSENLWSLLEEFTAGMALEKENIIYFTKESNIFYFILNMENFNVLIFNALHFLSNFDTIVFCLICQ